MPRSPSPDPAEYRRFVRFVELDEFGDDWQGLGLDLEHNLWDLQSQIMKSPAAPVMRGTGGLRKLRFAPAGESIGKRGAIRVCYATFPRYRVVLLVRAYGKAIKDNLTQRERQGIKTYLAQVESWLAATSAGERPR